MLEIIGVIVILTTTFLVGFVAGLALSTKALVAKIGDSDISLLYKVLEALEK